MDIVYALWNPLEERPFQDVRGSALICFRLTGNCSMSSSMVMPSSRFSNTRATGGRVPLNTQAPLTLPLGVA
jgi:hypothetical protein